MNTTLIEKVIRQHGYAKVAYEVLRQRGEYVPRDGSVYEHVLSLTTKMAQRQQVARKVQTGIEAYRQILEG